MLPPDHGDACTPACATRLREVVRTRVVVIVNANARKFVEQRSLLVDVDRLAEGRATVFVTRTRHELAAAVAAARQASASTVVLCGGDGSYRAGATVIVDAYGSSPRPTLAFAPGGT